MNTRQATADEIAKHCERSIRNGDKIRFRHYVRECGMRSARNGVKHVEHGRSKLTIRDGVPTITYRGTVEPVTATLYTLDSGLQGIFDIRLLGL